MALYEKVGFNRLAKLISLLGFAATYIILFIIERYVSIQEALIEFPIISLIGAVGVFYFTKFVYWVIDGFNE